MKEIDNYLSKRNVAAYPLRSKKNSSLKNPRKLGIEVRVGKRRLVGFALKEMLLSYNFLTL